MNTKEFQLGRADRISGLPCLATNGSYLDGWYSVEESNRRVLALYAEMFPGRAYPGDGAALQQVAELRVAIQSPDYAKAEHDFLPNATGMACRVCGRPLTGHPAPSLDAAKAEGVATRMKRITRPRLLTPAEAETLRVSRMVEHETAFVDAVVPFLRRLQRPRFDRYETNDYVCGSSECANALKALKALDEARGVQS